ncbi:hypothetical protein [Paenibacillus artemisiicola]|uniref:hypothetical protein n=1 Tax=Paenibacillus artemisiicola TaxID=1172618 RepID=UPI001AD66481|nr:hypothetical protein [Paenibacillus artemisiicola]
MAKLARRCSRHDDAVAAEAAAQRSCSLAEDHSKDDPPTKVDGASPRYERAAEFGCSFWLDQTRLRLPLPRSPIEHANARVAARIRGGKGRAAHGSPPFVHIKE